MFKKVLIANRGEIACRIIETCHRFNIRCVAVFSEADRQARHVLMADEAYAIGGASPNESYLRSDKILEVAVEHHVEAIHPGYGFLSENSDFSAQCQEKGVVFIGPGANAIDAMGSKSQAKHIMDEAKVPIVPGYHGDDQDSDRLKVEAEKTGYPLMIKAVAGGGGKGMRLVERSEDFSDMLAAVKRESTASFGNDKVLLERFVQSPRHIEFQIFGDHHGNVIHLFERECSIQRRHQKVLEETPSPFLDEILRQQMGEAAVKAAKAIDYVGAGTVEFIVGADRQFYFMEMNTRLQVEHPVTEMTTGIDLVEWQLRVAAQETLPLKQSDLQQKGHSIEVRVYAENPNNRFLPSIGLLKQWNHPETDAFVRVDTGVVQGDTISIHYDPMLAKLIVWDENRQQSLHRLQTALSQTSAIGVQTNIAFLQAIAKHPAFMAGLFDTSFIDAHLDTLLKLPEKTPPLAFWSAAIWLLRQREAQQKQTAAYATDPYSPWGSLDHWRLNLEEPETLTFRVPEADSISLKIQGAQKRFEVSMEADTEKHTIEVIRQDAYRLILADQNEQKVVEIHQEEDDFIVILDDHQYLLSRVQLHLFEEDLVDGIDHIVSPMPGRIIRLQVAPQDSVKQGQTLLILEAMKMEQPIQAPHDGIVEEVHYKEGDIVEADSPLITLGDPENQ